MNPAQQVVMREILDILNNCLVTMNTAPERIPGVLHQVHSVNLMLSTLPLTNFTEIWPVTLREILSTVVQLISSHIENFTTSPSCNRFRISRASLATLLSLGFSVAKMSKLYGCCTRTVFRRMNELGLSVSDTYSSISESDLEAAVMAILARQPNTGYKRMKGHLNIRGIRVRERRLRFVMRTVDPVGVAQRTSRRNRVIRRRQYYVKHSNEIWHIDANLKLTRWGFVIRAGVDGKSRAATYIAITSDNRSGTHLQSFLKGVAEWGLPLRTRTDKGKENMGIAMCMIENRGTGRSSHICGRSVHNQRVERFWRDLSEGCIAVYYNLFAALEQEGQLDMTNLKQVYLLHWIFLPRLNASAQEFMNGWNHHPIRTTSNMTPMQIMATNLFPAEYDSLIEDLVDTVTGDLMISNFEDMELMNEDSITSPIEVTNTLNELENERLLLFNRMEDEHNILVSYDLFIKAVREILN